VWLIFISLIVHDHLLASFYTYQNDRRIIIGGNFNSRIGDNDDFISGVDCLPKRSIVDNTHGEKFIQFLIDSNTCMLNGRILYKMFYCYIN
jgi:hypothetical protein